MKLTHLFLLAGDEGPLVTMHEEKVFLEKQEQEDTESQEKIEEITPTNELRITKDHQKEHVIGTLSTGIHTRLSLRE